MKFGPVGAHYTTELAWDLVIHAQPPIETAAAAGWLEQVEVPASVRVQVDVDPYSFM